MLGKVQPFGQTDSVAVFILLALSVVFGSTIVPALAMAYMSGARGLGGQF